MRVTVKHIEEYLKYGQCSVKEETNAVIYGIMISENSETKVFNTEKEFYENIVLEANNYLKKEELYTSYISKKYI